MEICVTKSIAEIILDYKMSKIRKYLLQLLIPKELYEAPAIKLAELSKGMVIGSVVINTIDSNSKAILDIGISK